MATEVMKVLMIILIGVGPVKTDELLRLILVISNGETTPSITLKESVWAQEGISQLTKYGIEQEYRNGLYIRDLYTNPNSSLHLLDPYNHRKLIEVQSSPHDANLMSTETFLRGLYKPSNITEEHEKPEIMRPVPIYETEYLDVTDCIGRREIVTREEMNTWDIVAFWGQNQDKIYDLYNKVGYDGNGINMLEQLYKVYQYQGFYDLPQEKALSVYEDILSEGHELIWNSKMFWSISSVRALAGKAMSELNTKISECENNSCSTEQLLVIYTCTVDTLAWIEEALGIYRGYEPVPGTMLQLEMWGSDNGTYITVKQTQNLRSKEVPVRNCTLKCDVYSFLKITEEYSATPEELETLCADATYLLKLLTDRLTTVLVSTLTVFCLFGVVLYLVRSRSDTVSLEAEKSRWSKLLQDDDGF